MTKKPLFLMLILALAGCAATSPRVVTGGLPGVIDEENVYADEDVYLTEFAVSNKSSADTKAAEEALRKQVLVSLRESAGFKNVIDATSGSPRPPENALKLSLSFQPGLEGGGISFMAAYYEMFLLFGMLSPRSGTALLTGTATLTRGRRALSTKTWSSSQPFSYSFYGMYRTGPIQEAYRAAYKDVLKRVLVPVASEAGTAGVSKEELKSLVAASVKEATKKEEKVYRSSVDKPSYAEPEDPNKFAFIVGIEGYSSIPKADYAERDAQTLKAHLLARGYPQRNIVHLAGSAASRANIEKYVESWMPSRVTEDSQVVFYFSGHGSPGIGDGQAYLVPWDGDVAYLENTGYPLKRLYKKLNELKASKVVVLLDSCFSGAGGRSVIPKGARPLVGKVDSAAGELGKLLVVSASAGDEITGGDENEGHGLFTLYLLKGLNERGGKVRLQGLYDYLLPNVQNAAREQNRDQTPQLRGPESLRDAFQL